MSCSRTWIRGYGGTSVFGVQYEGLGYRDEGVGFSI